MLTRARWGRTRPRLVAVARLLLALSLLACTESSLGPLLVASAGRDDAPTLWSLDMGTGGTLVIDEGCVLLKYSGPPGIRNTSILIWPAERTVWRPADRSIAYLRLNGERLTLADGDRVTLHAGTNDAWILRTTEDDIAAINAAGQACGALGRWWVTDIQVQ
jgi:hypothetical protein